MRWKSDWLYNLVFNEVERLWTQVQKEGTGKFGFAPERFYVQQFENADWQELNCLPPIIRSWIFDGLVPTLLSNSSKPLAIDQTSRGMFFVSGTVHFHISNNRKEILWTYRLGRRYGRGMVFSVEGQGKASSLQRNASFGEWVS